MKLIEYIKEKGISQRKCAKKWGFKSGSFWRICKEVGTPTLFQACKIFEETHGEVDFFDFLTEEQKCEIYRESEMNLRTREGEIQK